MRQEVPEVVVQAALQYTRATTLEEAILALLGTEIKQCANEFCQKEFVFQEPFPKRKPRSDAQYCSDICARRATQRAYLRRKRAKTQS